MEERRATVSEDGVLQSNPRSIRLLVDCFAGMPVAQRVRASPVTRTVRLERASPISSLGIKEDRRILQRAIISISLLHVCILFVSNKRTCLHSKFIMSAAQRVGGVNEIVESVSETIVHRSLFIEDSLGPIETASGESLVASDSFPSCYDTPSCVVERAFHSRPVRDALETPERHPRRCSVVDAASSHSQGYPQIRHFGSGRRIHYS